MNSQQYSNKSHDKLAKHDPLNDELDLIVLIHISVYLD